MARVRTLERRLRLRVLAWYNGGAESCSIPADSSMSPPARAVACVEPAVGVY
jgi:hypothetical protein